MQGKVCIRDDLLHSIWGSLSCFPWVQWAKKKYPGSEAVRGRWKRSVFKMRTVGTISIFLFLVVCAAIDLKKRSLPMWLLWAGSLGVLLISLWNTRLNLFPLFQGAGSQEKLSDMEMYGSSLFWGFISESGIPSPWYALRSFSAVLPQWDVWFGKNSGGIRGFRLFLFLQQHMWGWFFYEDESKCDH